MIPFLIDIPRRNKCCKNCQTIFHPGEEYFTSLSEENSSFIRNDFCIHCWKNENTIAQNSFWKAKVPAKEKEDLSNKNKDENAMQLFKESLSSKTPEEMAKAFILALYLTRRKMLSLRKELKKTSNETILVYEVTDTEEMIGVKKISYTTIDIADIQKKIAQRLFS